MNDHSPTAPPESRSMIGHYLWDHPTLLPRVARVEDADFARGDPEWVRCYPVEVVIPSASPPEAATLPVVASDENAVRALGIYYQLMPSEAAKLTPSLRERMRGVLLCVGSDAQAALDTLAAEVERLTGELAAAQVDASRYRWLRDISEPGICTFYLSVGKAFDGVKFARDTVDEAIDAQISSALARNPSGVGEEGRSVALVSHAETVSKPGAAIQVQVLHLTDAGRECLTLRPAEVNHLNQLLGWAGCEVGQSPDEMVQTVRELAAKGLETDQAGKARILQAHQAASNVPKYIRAAIKSLRAAMATKGAA